jgi:N-acetylmuramic acid 6-phosphate etherase
MSRTNEFLKIAKQFQLGHLITESAHPATHQLSQLSQSDLPQALKLLQSVDTSALKVIENKIEILWDLYLDVKKTLEAGHDVLLVGCGATGRLSMVIETLSLQLKRYPGRIRSFMAGGDYALIKSVESFEDRTPYGDRQLHDLGFKSGDLLLAITEGGETPFVIGACLEAARISNNAPWFLYCNPDSTLEGLDRCREVLNHSHVKKFNLTCGAMALTGSTRMQASTVQMAAAGLAILQDWKSLEEMKNYWCAFQEWYQLLDLEGVISFIEAESMALGQKHLTTYVCDSELAISLLTDTTERSPTFSQPAFENILEATPPAPIYLVVRETHSPDEAWRKLLGRTPRCLEWSELNGKINQTIMNGFDISENSLPRRAGHVVSFTELPGRILWQREMASWSMPLFDRHPLMTHLTLKMVINMLSTLMMGRRGFYLDNVMTWVKPSNNKLIDRATRYVQLLATRRGQEIEYEEGVRLVIEEMDKDLVGPVVIRVLASLGIKS